MPEKPVLLGPLLKAIHEAVAGTPSAIAQRAWPEVAGEKTAAHARVDGVVGDTLRVTCDTPTRAHYLQLRSRELLRRMQEIGALSTEVCRIRFRSSGRPQADESGQADCGSSRDGRSLQAPARPGREVALCSILPEELQAELERIAGQLDDPHLAQALKKALAAASVAGKAEITSETHSR